jgi:hypothetical protein
MRDLPDMPDLIAALERDHRGLPIAWFVRRPADGPIDFRVMDMDRHRQALQERRCWVCGEPLDKEMAFVGGPLSAAQRLYSDPPAHPECAEFSAKVCPFLAIPTAHRREANKPADLDYIPGQVASNPEVVGILISDGFEPIGMGVIRANPAIRILWYHEGREASRREIKAAIHAALQREEVRTSANAAGIRRMAKGLPLPTF